MRDKSGGTMFAARYFLSTFADPHSALNLPTAIGFALGGPLGALFGEQIQAGQNAKNAARDLKDEQAKQLKAQQDAAAAEVARQAVTGSHFGTRVDPVAGAFGFATAGRTGFGRAELTGGS